MHEYGHEIASRKLFALGVRRSANEQRERASKSDDGLRRALVMTESDTHKGGCHASERPDDQKCELLPSGKQSRGASESDAEAAMRSTADCGWLRKSHGHHY